MDRLVVDFPYAICWIAIFLLLGCNSKPEISEANINEDSIIQINVSEDDINLEEFTNSLNISSISHLETTGESVFGEPTKTVILNNVLYIYSRDQQEILRFDLKGGFINKLIKKGKGPEEYIDLRDFQVYDDNSVSILTQNKIMYYDAGFNLIRTYDIGIRKNSKVYINPTQFHEEDSLFYLWNGTIEWDHYSDRLQYLIYTSFNGEISEGYFPVTKKVLSFGIFSESKQNTLLTPALEDNKIYRIDDNHVYACYKIDFGKNNLPDEANKPGDLSETNYCYNIHSAYETENFLYFQFYKGWSIYQGIYSKKSGKCKIGRMIPITKIECANEDNFIALIQPAQLKTVLPFLEERTKFNRSVLEKLANLEFNIYENPILCSFSIEPF